MRQKLTGLYTDANLHNETEKSINDKLNLQVDEKSTFTEIVSILFEWIMKLDENYESDAPAHVEMNKIGALINLLLESLHPDKLIHDKLILNLIHSKKVNECNKEEYLKELLHSALQFALKIEHSTIPPYLTALYSIKRGYNHEASSIIRSVAIEEMLHMIMMCNVLNSMDYQFNILDKKLIPKYPYHFPFGVPELIDNCADKIASPLFINIGEFSPESVDSFIAIESPISKLVKPVIPTLQLKLSPLTDIANENNKKIQSYFDDLNVYDLIITHLPTDKIGQFYEFITVLTFTRQWLSKKPASTISYKDFCEGGVFSKSNITKQITSEQYYGSGGTLLTVKDFHQFLAVVNEIMGQGEGTNGEMIAPDQRPDQEGLELAHYFRFMEIKYGKYYEGGDYSEDIDKEGQMSVTTPPKGNSLHVDWKNVYKIKHNLKLSEIQDEGLKKVLIDFNTNYKNLIEYIQKAVTEECKNTQNEFLHNSIMHMHQMHHQAEAIMKIPYEGDVNAAPTWEIA